jgi:integrase
MDKQNTSPVPRRVRVEPGIYRRPDGLLEIGWKDTTGKQRWRGPFKGVKLARAALAEEHARRARGEKIADDPRLKFNDAAEAWWSARVVKLRPATQSAYRASLIHLREQFGRRRMSDITPSDVAAYVSIKQSEGQKGWTIKGQMTVLGAIFNYSARHLGLVGTTNPVSLLDRVERPSSDDESEQRILTGDELGRLLSAIEDDYRPVFALAAESGGRLSEVLGLVWSEINFEAQTVNFTHQLGRDGKRHLLKTKQSRRVLEVTPSIIATLRKLKLASARSGDHDFVFLSRAGTAHDQRNIGGRVLSRAVKRSGLEAVERDGEIIVPAPTFHDLRHTHASALIAQGWDIAEVSARLGHSSVATTLRIYAHQFDQANRSDERRSRLTALYGSPMEASVEATEGHTSAQTGTDDHPNVQPLRALGDSRA